MWEVSKRTFRAEICIIEPDDIQTPFVHIPSRLTCANGACFLFELISFVELCTKSALLREDVSRKDAKTQRRKALPRFAGLSLRLCAFAGEYPRSGRFCAKPLC